MADSQLDDQPMSFDSQLIVELIDQPVNSQLDSQLIDQPVSIDQPKNDPNKKLDSSSIGQLSRGDQPTNKKLDSSIIDQPKNDTNMKLDSSIDHQPKNDIIDQPKNDAPSERPCRKREYSPCATPPDNDSDIVEEDETFSCSSNDEVVMIAPGMYRIYKQPVKPDDMAEDVESLPCTEEDSDASWVSSSPRGSPKKMGIGHDIGNAQALSQGWSDVE